MKRTSSQNITKLALAGSLVAGASTAAQAAVVITNPSSVTLSSSSSSNVLSFNLATGVFGQNTTPDGAQFNINYDGGNTGKIRLAAIAGGNGAVLYNTNGSKVVNVPLGTQISAASGNFAGSNVQPYLSFVQDDTSQFRYGVLGYAGLAFVDPNTGNLDFGYASVTVNSDNSVTVSRLAYENTGAPITVVPEPSSVALTLLASGAAGALLVRRRRQARLLAA